MWIYIVGNRWIMYKTFTCDIVHISIVLQQNKNKFRDKTCEYNLKYKQATIIAWMYGFVKDTRMIKRGYFIILRMALWCVILSCCQGYFSVVRRVWKRIIKRLLCVKLSSSVSCLFPEMCFKKSRCVSKKLSL